MNFPTAPLNNLYVTIEKKFYDTVTFASGIVLYKDTTFHPEEAAMLIAKVISVPKAIQQRYDYNGMQCIIKPGDTVLMRYDVVFSYVDQPERDTPIYKNVLLYNGVEYWKVDLQKVFAIQRGADWEMINGYVLCEPYNETVSFGKLLLVPAGYQTVQRNHTMKVRYINTPLTTAPVLPVLPDDLIHVVPDVAQLYEIDQKPFYIIKQSHILAKHG